MRERRDFRDDVEDRIGSSESDYDRIARTKEHWWCLWNDHGVKCGKPATFLTTVLASRTKNGHESQLRGGYCAEHQKAIEARVAEEKASGGRDWRDQLVDAAIRARGVLR